MGIRGVAVLAVVVALAASPVTSACTPWTSGYGTNTGRSNLLGGPFTTLHPLPNGDVIRVAPYETITTQLAVSSQDVTRWVREKWVPFAVRNVLYSDDTILRLAGNARDGPAVSPAEWGNRDYKPTLLQGAPSPMRGACELPNGDVFTWGARTDNTNPWIARYTFQGQPVWMHHPLPEIATLEAGAADCTQGAALAGRDAAGTPRLALVTPEGETAWTMQPRALVGDAGTARDLDFQTDGRILLLYEWVAPVLGQRTFVVLKADPELRESTELVRYENGADNLPSTIVSRADGGFFVTSQLVDTLPDVELIHEPGRAGASWHAFDALGIRHAGSGMSSQFHGLRADALVEVEGGIYWSFSNDPPGNYVQAGYFQFLRPHGGACPRLDLAGA